MVPANAWIEQSPDCAYARVRRAPESLSLPVRTITSRLCHRAAVAALILVDMLVLMPGRACAQADAGNPAAEQGVPGAPDPTAPHQGTAPPAAVQQKQQPPAVDLSILYTAEVWHNASGGIRRGSRTLDNLDVTLTVDAERVLGWRGATLFVYGLRNNGHAFSGDLVGDAQTVSNIETGVRATRLYQAWIEQRFAGDRASLKAGLYDLNSEFDTTNVGSLSLLSSHGIGPEFAQSGRNGPSIFPYTSLGVRGEVKAGAAVTLRAAILDGVPDDADHPRRTAIRLGHGDGALGVAEADYVGSLANVTIGVWRYTARFDAWPSSGTIRSGHGNGGGYLVVERRLLRADAASADDKRGLAGFVQAGVADPRTNRFARYLGGGLVYTGVAGADDRLGLTLAHAVFSDGYRNLQAANDIVVAGSENVVELTYRRALARFLTVQPDIQYVVHPSNGPTRHDAVALGLRIEVGG